MKIIEQKILEKGKASYPEKLLYIDNPPQKLYVLGDVPKSDKKSVAIVGARVCSNYGRQIAYEYAGILAKEGVQIISGMAMGIDTAAHQGAIVAGGNTYAVLGSGVDVCYPSSNRDLYEKIKLQGGIISEFENNSKPLAWHFPLRNRIISGLADVIIVVEAREKSGSLITADLALEQGKDVFAVPGRVGDELSAGCNRLISEGAGIAWTPDEILLTLFHENKYNSRKNNVTDKSRDNNCKSAYKKNNQLVMFQQKNISGLAREEKMLYSCMGLQPLHINELIRKTGLELPNVLNAIFSLEHLGLVEETTKNYFVIKVV